MKSINTRIIALLGFLVFIVCVGLGIAAYVTSSDSLVNITEDTISKFALEASITIQDGIQNQFNTLSLIAGFDGIKEIEAVNGDLILARSVMSNEVKRAGHKEMILIDKNGKALYHNGRTEDLSGNALFKKALAGENAVSDPAYNRDGTAVEMSFAVPVVVNNQVAGVLVAVRDGLELSELAARIKYGKSGEAFIVNSKGRTIAHADKELMQSIIGNGSVEGNSSATAKEAAEPSGEVEITTTATPAATNNFSLNNRLGFEGYDQFEKDMMEGKIGSREYKYNSISKIAGFSPVEGYGWSVAVSVNKDEVLAGLAGLKAAFQYISVVFLILGFIVAYFIGRSISKPISRLTGKCLVMAEGDFSVPMEAKYLKRRDELGELARGFNRINENVSDIIRNVLTETNTGVKITEISRESMAVLSDEIKRITELTQQLSMKMQETSAMAEEMNATAVEIETAIDSIAVKAQEGAESAAEISRRANGLKNTALDSQRGANDIRAEVDEKLRKAIEKSKSVEKISILSDVILDISSRTNLLALNASIEAAQAGESGRGFAVVAGEIRKLAEHSKHTVEEIQQVTSQVLEAVQNLSVCSGQVLEFLDTRVAKDYEMFVETGEQYNKDALLIDELVTDLSATSEQLFASIQSMVQVINDVAEAANKGAAETAEMFDEAEDVDRRSKEVLEQTNSVNESAGKLKELVSIFKV